MVFGANHGGFWQKLAIRMAWKTKAKCHMQVPSNFGRNMLFEWSKFPTPYLPLVHVSVEMLISTAVQRQRLQTTFNSAKPPWVYRTAFHDMVVFSGGAAIVYTDRHVAQALFEIVFFPERKARLDWSCDNRSIESLDVHHPIETKVVVQVSAIDPWTLREVLGLTVGLSEKQVNEIYCDG